MQSTAGDSELTTSSVALGTPVIPNIMASTAWDPTLGLTQATQRTVSSSTCIQCFFGPVSPPIVQGSHGPAGEASGWSPRSMRIQYSHTYQSPPALGRPDQRCQSIQSDGLNKKSPQTLSFLEQGPQKGLSPQQYFHFSLFLHHLFFLFLRQGLTW